MQPLYLDGARGRLFGLHFAPEPAAEPRAPVLFIPPFAEEMNRARRTVTQQAKQLSQHGHAVLLFDLYGTGDSMGSFQDARWEDWRDDILLMAQWLSAKQDAPVLLWALRLGALLALDSFYHHPDLVRRHVFWNPVMDGKPYLDQFLRQSLGEGNGRSGVSLDGLRLRIEKSEPLEVIGYTLSRQMLHAIDRSRALDLVGARTAPIVWIESASSNHATATQAAETLRAAGARLETVFCRGAAFWAIEGVRPHGDLSKLTCAAMEVSL